MTVKKMPPITITAAGSRGKIPLHKLGRPVVLLFLWQETEALADGVRDMVRAKYPQPAQVLIVNLADLRGIPRLLRRMVEPEMAKGYKRTVAKLPAGTERPHEHVIILPDWKGEVAQAVGAADTHETPAVAVMDADAAIIGLYQGFDLAEAAMELLAKIKISEE
ncbi:hypothetical protein ACFLZW_05520 [Chloroflexota bacterium]